MEMCLILVMVYEQTLMFLCLLVIRGLSAEHEERLISASSMLLSVIISGTCVRMVGAPASYSEDAGYKWRSGYQLSWREVLCDFPQS